MRVLHYVTGISRDIGGIEKFILNIAEKSDYRIDILTRNVYEDSIAYSMLCNAGVIVYNLNMPHLNIRNIIPFWKAIADFFKHNSETYDSLHIHYVVEPFLAKYAKQSGIKLTMLHVHSKVICSNLIFQIIKRYFIKLNCRWSDYYLACSKDVANKVYPAKYHEKIIVINNGIDCSQYRFEPEIRELYKEKYNAHGIVMCHVGRFVKIKNHEFIIDIFIGILRNYPDAKLILAGEGPEKKNIQEKCKKNKIDEKVIFLGDVKDITPYLSMSDAFIFPSFSEGLGIVAIEAQANGLPVVASLDNVPKEVAITDLVKFIPLSNNPDEWLSMIVSSIVLEKNTRREYNEKVVRAGFDISTTVEQLTKLYISGGKNK